MKKAGVVGSIKESGVEGGRGGGSVGRLSCPVASEKGWGGRVVDRVR